jgi:hypothetical protein
LCLSSLLLSHSLDRYIISCLYSSSGGRFLFVYSSLLCVCSPLARGYPFRQALALAIYLDRLTGTDPDYVVETHPPVLEEFEGVMLDSKSVCLPFFLLFLRSSSLFPVRFCPWSSCCCRPAVHTTLVITVTRFSPSLTAFPVLDYASILAAPSATARYIVQ